LFKFVEPLCLLTQVLAGMAELQALLNPAEPLPGITQLLLYEPGTANLQGVELREMQDCETCCGFGGTFSIKFGDISAAMADAKCERIAASGAQAVVLGDLGCMLNIEGRLRRRGDERTRVLHIAELLSGRVDA